MTSAPLPPIEQSLLCRTPLSARRLLYIGGAAEPFAAAAWARNPDAEITSDPEDGATFDCCIVSGLKLADLASHAARLADGGLLVASVPALDDDEVKALLPALPGAGLAWLVPRPLGVAAPFDDLADDLRAAIREQRACPAMIVVCGKGTAPPESLALRIVAFSPYLMDIRTTLPAQALRSAPEMAVVYSETPVTLPTVPAGQPKILVLQKPAAPNPDTWRKGIAHICREGWLAVMEYDDHPELVASMRGTLPDWHRFAGIHAIQTSTPSLVQPFRRWNPEVQVFPNAAFDITPFPDGPAARRVFFGGLRRGRQAVEIMRSFEKLPQEFPDLEFVVVGDRTIFDAIPTPRKTFHAAVPYADYLRIMASCAISLATMENLPMLETKSDCKFIDASSRGLLTIASPTIYAEVIRHGETGLIAERTEDWAPMLAGVLRDEDRRRGMARTAWEYVRDNRMFRDQLAGRLDWYRSLWERRDILTKGLIERTPGMADALSQGPGG